MEEQFIIEIWDTFRDHIPEKGRGVAAEQFVDFLVSKDVELETFEGLLGYDPSLDTAIEMVLEEHRDEENDYEEYDEEEEEDY